MKEARYELHPYSYAYKGNYIFHNTTMSEINQNAQYHEGLELLYIKTGHLHVKINNRDSCFVQENDIILFNPNDIHEIRSDYQQTQFYCLIIGNDFMLNFDISPDDVYLNNLIHDSVVCSKVDTLIHEYSSQQKYYKNEMLAQVLSLLIYLIRNHGKTDLRLDANITCSKVNLVNYLLRYIQSNFTKNITLDQLSSKVNFSKYHICRVFKELTGMTIRSYINQLRCNYAKTIILNKNHTIKEAMMLSGFNNTSYFSKIYKKYLGVVPSETFSLKMGDSFIIRTIKEGSNRDLLDISEN